jgi:proteasome lid subunit RPN8/RPN11
MSLEISPYFLNQIQAYGESAYPEEVCGLLLGINLIERKQVIDVLKISNIREEGSRHKRYLLSPHEYLTGELLAEQRGLEVIGVFHSHPDHDACPSEIDLESAIPGFVYLITSLETRSISEEKQTTSAMRAWRLAENSRYFIEEQIYENRE